VVAALILLIQATPAAVFADGPVVRGVLTLVIAAALGIISTLRAQGKPPTF
jgi:hypothetical protein